MNSNTPSFIQSIFRPHLLVTGAIAFAFQFEGIAAQPFQETKTASTPVEIHVQEAEEAIPSTPWFNGSAINIMADESPINDVLQEFGNQMNIRVFCSPGLHGKVSGRFVNLTPKKFLEQLSRAYGLDWIYYNHQIYFSSNAEGSTVVRTLKYLPTEQAVKVVDQMGIFSVGASIRSIPGTPMIMLSGPPKFLEMAQEVIATLEQQSAFKQTSEVVIQVFPLNYAWAYDVQLAGGTQVQGVATTLAQLALRNGGNGGKGVNTLGSTSSAARPLGGNADMAGTQGAQQPGAVRALPAGGANASAFSTQSTAITGSGDGYGASSTGSNLLSITSDVRSNSVIVRDIRENMDFYKAAIAKLDVPVKIVEISAAIVDADVSSNRFLGFRGIQLTGPGFSAGTNTGNGSTGGNVNLSGVYGTTSITAALDFLENNNKAKTVSRPSLVTLDNFAASIGNDETFFIQNPGSDQVAGSVYSVASGLTLQVVPHITVERGQQQIYMQVSIQDGDRTSQSVGKLPVIKNTHLITQSIVRKDQSLLVGGLYRTVDKNNRSGYPWLSKIPVVNFFFSNSNREKAVVERMILLTPRVIDIYANNLGNYGQYFRPSPEVGAAMHQPQQATSTTALPPRARPEVRRAL